MTVELRRIAAGHYLSTDGRFEVTQVGYRSWTVSIWYDTDACPDHLDTEGHWCPQTGCDSLRECKDWIDGCG